MCTSAAAASADGGSTGSCGAAADCSLRPLGTPLPQRVAAGDGGRDGSVVAMAPGGAGSVRGGWAVGVGTPVANEPRLLLVPRSSADAFRETRPRVEARGLPATLERRPCWVEVRVPGPLATGVPATLPARMSKLLAAVRRAGDPPAVRVRGVLASGVLPAAVETRDDVTCRDSGCVEGVSAPGFARCARRAAPSMCARSVLSRRLCRRASADGEDARRELDR